MNGRRGLLQTGVAQFEEVRTHLCGGPRRRGSVWFDEDGSHGQRVSGVAYGEQEDGEAGEEDASIADVETSSI